jgi:hypothetical protein
VEPKSVRSTRVNWTRTVYFSPTSSTSHDWRLTVQKTGRSGRRCGGAVFQTEDRVETSSGADDTAWRAPLRIRRNEAESVA